MHVWFLNLRKENHSIEMGISQNENLYHPISYRTNLNKLHGILSGIIPTFTMCFLYPGYIQRKHLQLECECILHVSYKIQHIQKLPVLNNIHLKSLNQK